MRLSKIEIVGFKSFRSQTGLLIDRGMTCLVGPNGCGKSNIVDALKWAMGEQRAKDLRGAEMADVIFAGSATHPPLGMAEVTVTFDNPPHSPKPTDRQAPISAESRLPALLAAEPEIAVTRRLFRNGTSEYRINGSRCRLRDVQAVFLGTGLGKGAPYSIVEQGKITEMVSARPAARRKIIEEAAGISRYHHQRQMAQRRVESTRANLERVEDILAEVSAAARKLQRQTARARRHRRYREELETLEVSVVTATLEGLRGTIAQRTREHADALAAWEQIRKRTGAEQRQLEITAVELEVTRRKTATATRAVHESESDTKVLAAELRHLTAEVDRLAQHGRELADRDRRDREATQRWEADLTQVEHERDELVEEDFELDKLQEVAHRRADESARKQALFDAARADLADLGAHLARGEAQVGGLTKSLALVQTNLEGLAEGESTIAQRLREATASVGELEAQVSEATDGARGLAEAFADREAALVSARAELRAATEHHDAVRRDRMDSEGRLQILRALHGSGEAYGVGVEAVLAAVEAGRLSGTGPTLAEALRPEPGLEAALASLLGERLRYLLVRDYASAWAALEIASEAGGRVGCVVVPADLSDEDLAVWLSDSVARARVASSLEDLVSGSSPAVTRAGQGLVAPGIVVGGGADQGGTALLRDAAEIRRLDVEVAALCDEESRALATLAWAKANMNSCAEASESCQGDLSAVRQRLARAQVELVSLVDREASLCVSVTDTRRRRAELESSRRSHAEQLATAKVELDGVSDAWAAASEALDTVDADRRRAAEAERRAADALAQARVRAGRLEERQTALGRRREELAARLREAHARRDLEAERRVAHRNDVAEVEGAIATCRERLDTATSALADRRTALERAQQALDHAQELAQTARDALEAHRRSTVAAERAVEAALAKLEGLDREATALEHRHQTEFGGANPDLGTNFDIEAAETRIAELRLLLRDLGSVNQLAEQEYEDTATRAAFIEGQKADLHEAIANLEGVIESLDEESDRRFVQTFAAVSAEFSKVFAKLFVGGDATLLLTDESDLRGSGVEIVARPPGKELQSISLLSGGEKALAGIALVFAILTLRPAPLCILDEVDAPLDDANVGRYAALVAEMAEDLQMLVITHNKRTMARASRIYGVTMEESGCSKLLSLRIEERRPEI